MIAQSRAESTWEIDNYGKYINQFPPNTIKSIRQYERINKKICRQKMSIMFNEICIYIYIIIIIIIASAAADRTPAPSFHRFFSRVDPMSTFLGQAVDTSLKGEFNCRIEGGTNYYSIIISCVFGIYVSIVLKLVMVVDLEDYFTVFILYWLICLVGKAFANDSRDLGSIPGRVIPKTFKIALDTSLLNTRQYKVRIEGKVEQSRERSSALPYTSCREPSGRPRLRSVIL